MNSPGPVITRPNRTIHFGQQTLEAASPHQQPGANPFSPVAFFQNTMSRNSPQSPSVSANSLTPRAPIVHFFVCDNGNAKVKALTDQFIELLVNNGIKVYTEGYLTHQPGYQVRAASLNTDADFFCQIHSKTAGPGHVRLYFNGQPKRMTMEEAVADIWAWWRLKCGALSKEEVDVISREKILYVLKEFASIEPQNLDYSAIQAQGREAIERGSAVHSIIEKLHDFESTLLGGKNRVMTTRTIATEWVREPGSQLTRCLPMPIISGLSHPLREVILNVIEQSLNKCQSLMNIFVKYNITTPPPQLYEEENLREIPIDGPERPSDGSSWRMMIESIDDDHQIGSMQIASYGDNQQPTDPMGNVNPLFLLDGI